jgi:RimJ/RimL family protein N-acetyltransferase
MHNAESPDEMARAKPDEPATKPKSNQRAAKMAKDREMQSRFLAESVVDQLVKAGYPFGDVLNFASDVLRAINEHPASDAEWGPEPVNDDDAEREVIRFRVEGGAAPDALRIVGPRVYLRPVVPNDGQVLRDWASEQAIRATFSERTLAEVIQHIDQLPGDQARHDFIVCLQEDQPTGMVCLHQIDPVIRQAEMTKLLGVREARGHGYAREATLLLLAYAFDKLGLERVYLRTAGLNMRNIRLNERIGFQYEGVLRRAASIADNIVDVVLMGILVGDFRRRYRVLTED